LRCGENWAASVWVPPKFGGFPPLSKLCPIRGHATRFGASCPHRSYKLYASQLIPCAIAKVFIIPMQKETIDRKIKMGGLKVVLVFPIERYATKIDIVTKSRNTVLKHYIYIWY
jgi:hypothetical protein